MTVTHCLEMLISCSLQILVLVGVCMLLEKFFAKPSDQYQLWNVCFFGVLLIIGISLVFPRFRPVHPWADVDTQTLLTAAAVESIAFTIIVATWLLGAVVMLSRWLLHEALLRFELWRCRPLSSEEVESVLHCKLEACANGEHPKILVSEQAIGPFCLQFNKPVIVISQALLAGSPQDLRNILIHECAHIKNNHPLQLFVQNLLQVVCWFHPAIWAASTRASLVREFCCDDAVLGAGIRCSAYLKTLFHIAESVEGTARRTAINFRKTPTEIVLRAQRLVRLAAGQGSSPERVRVKRRPAAAALLVTACLLAQVGIPVDPMTSSRNRWSSWPSWSARCLHVVGITVRDYETFDRRVRPYEQLQEERMDGKLSANSPG